MTKAQKAQAAEAGAPNQDVAAAASTAVSTNVMDIASLMQDAGDGNQNVTAKDMAIPLISVLQANSPQCKKMDAKFVPGAVEGSLYNNVTNEVYDGEHGFYAVPCFFEKVYIEWRPKRGGFVAIHSADTPLKSEVKMVKTVGEDGKEKYVPTLPNGNTFIETDQHYVLIMRDGGGFEPAVIPMSSSQLGRSKIWNSLVQRISLKGADGGQFSPARYYMSYHLTTKGKTKETYSWAIWNVSQFKPIVVVPGINDIRPVDDNNKPIENWLAPMNRPDIYAAAKALFEAVKDGNIRVKQEQTDDAAASTVSHSDDIPMDV